MTKNTISIYFSDLIEYALNKIYDKCRTNVYKNSPSECSWNPLDVDKSLKNNQQYTYKSLNHQVSVKVTPKLTLPECIQLGSLNSTDSTNTVAKQFKEYLIEKGIYSRQNSIMTTKSILYFFSCLAAFISNKVIEFTVVDNDNYAYILYNTTNLSTDIISINSTNYDLSNNSLQRNVEKTSVEDILKCILNKNSINPNELVVRYSSSSCSSSSCSCSCSSCSSSCSSSSSSFIVYMLI